MVSYICLLCYILCEHSKALCTNVCGHLYIANDSCNTFVMWPIHRSTQSKLDVSPPLLPLGAQGAGEDRLKRTLDSGALEGGYTKRRAALLDALGNAGSPESLGVLMGAATEEGSTLAVHHAAVRALRKFQCEEVSVFVCIPRYVLVYNCTYISINLYHGQHISRACMYLCMTLCSQVFLLTPASTLHPPPPPSTLPLHRSPPRVQMSCMI